MRRSIIVRAIGGLAAFALVIGAAPFAQADTDTVDSELTTMGAADNAEAAADLRGDIDFSVPGGTFRNEVTVSLSTSVPGAEIRYTTDGRLPNASSPVYSSPLRLTRSTQLRAQPFVGGNSAGDPGTAVYVAESVSTRHDLPVLIIDSFGRGLPQREYFDSAQVLIEPSGGTASLADSPSIATRAGFRLRGQSSASFDKKPYRLEFWDNDGDDADYSVLGMPADGDWVLRGPFTDKALIRDAFIYQLGSEMGLHAPRFRFVEVYVNGGTGPVSSSNYQGVYMIMERIENRSHRIDLKRLREERPEDRTEPRISGGYIFKFEWMAAEEPILRCSGSFMTCWNDLELVDPRNDDALPEFRSWITNHLQQFNDVINSSRYTDPQTGYRAWIDTRSWVDQLIINELSRDLDAYVRSAYFYKDRNEKINAGPLWDYDNTFGVGGAFQNDQIAGWQWQQTRMPSPNTWYPRLMEDPAFVNEVRARWAELRRGILSDSQLRARAQSLAAPLANAAQRNFQRWPNLTTRQIAFFTTPTASTWQGQVDYMVDWMLRRAAWLDSPAGWDIHGAPPPPPPTTAPPPTTGPPTTTPPTTPPGPGGCSADYNLVNQWDSGFQAEVRVSAGSAPIRGWTVNWTFTDGQTINQAWNATVSGSTTVTARNLEWNGALSPGASTTFGFTGTHRGSNSVPTLTCTAS